MRKRLFFALCFIAMILTFTSCKIGQGGGDDEGSPAQEGFIYSPGSELWIMYPENTDTEVLYSLVRPIEVARGEVSQLSQISSEKHPNEIIIGQSDRDVSKKAYKYLNRQDKEDSDRVGYVIYSDGSSVCLAYDDDIFDTDLALKTVIDHFVKNFVTGDTLALEKGIYVNEMFDLVERQREVDEQNRESKWNYLRIQIMQKDSLSEQAADEIISALKSYYSIYDENVLMWLADLYDSDNGGFYYSNSGRNTLGYAPDIESTRQAITLLENSGIFDGKTPDEALPDWMGDQIGKWVKSLQAENGFFYHPQWSVEEHKSSRLSRDLPQALSLLSYFGYRPTYDTIYGDKGDGMLADGTPVGVKATGFLTSNVEARVSQILPCADLTNYPDHLKTPEAFRKYLEEKIPINEDPYRMSNQLATQVGVIISRGREYRDILIEFLDSKQNPQTGLWTLDSISYAEPEWEGINSLLKLSDVYNQCGAPLKNAAKAAQASFEVLMNSPNNTFGSVCYVYNPWYAIENLRDNIQKYSGGDMTEMDALREKVLSMAPQAIARTAEAVRLFMKKDGSSSFGQFSSAATSVGMRVAVPNTNEGDVNGTLINLFGTLNHLMGVLGYKFIKPFGTAEYMLFIKRIEGLGTIIKDEIVDVEPIDFEGSSVGEQYVDFTYNWKSSGAAYVTQRPDGNGNALLIDSNNNGNDSVIIPSITPSLISNKFYFEADYCVTSGGGTIAQITFHPYVYMLSLHVGDYDGDGVANDIRLTEDSYSGWAQSITETIGTVAKLGEWFNIRMEYYIGTSDEVRCVVYINGELVLISNNYYGKSLTREVTPVTYCEGARISILSDKSVQMYVDNVLMNKTSDAYSVPKKFPEGMIVNVDAPDKEEKIYDFEEGGLEDITVTSNGDNITVSDDGDNKSLLISGNGGSSLNIPVNYRTAISNCSVFEADFTVDPSTSEGATYALLFKGRNVSKELMVRVHLVTKGTGNEGYTTVAMAHTGITGTLIKEIEVPHGTTFNIRVEYYQMEKTVLIYLDGKLLSASDLITSRANVNEFGEFVFSNITASSLNSSLKIDNIKVERNTLSFANATRPDVDEKCYDFDDNTIPSDITVSDATVSDGMLSINASSSAVVKIPVNKRSVVRTTTVFNALLDTTNMPNGGKFYISLVDESGNNVLVLRFVADNRMINIYEQTKNKNYSTAIGSWSKRSARLSIDYTYSKEIIIIKIDNVAVAISSVLYTENAASLSPDYVVIATSNKATLNIDNVTAESYNMVYKPASVTQQNTETGAASYTFETSSTGSIPATITCNLASANAETKVKEILVKNKFSKVLALSTSPGANDSITIPITKNNDKNYNAVALELDMKSNVTFDMFFAGNNTTFTGFYVAPNEICDYKNGKYSFSIKSVNNTEWHKYRFEYTLTEYDYNNDGKNDIAMNIYVDGVLLATGHNNWVESTAPASDIHSVKLYTHSATNGEVCIDNVVFERCNITVEPPTTSGGDSQGGEITEDDMIPGVYYEKIVETGKSWGTDYTGCVYFSLSVRNSSAVTKFLNISSQMNDYVSSTYGMITALDSDSVLMIGKSPTNHQVPEIAFYNVNSSDKNCIVFESDVMFSAQDSDQITVSEIFFSRFGFVSEYNRDDNYNKVYTTSKMLNMAELMGSFDPDTDKWGTLKYKDTAIESDKWYTVTMEYYQSEGVIVYYLDGTAINTVAVGKNLACNNVVFQLQGQAHGSAIYFDSTYFGSVDKAFSGEMPEVPTKDWREGGEYSSSAGDKFNYSTVWGGLDTTEIIDRNQGTTSCDQPIETTTASYLNITDIGGNNALLLGKRSVRWAEFYYKSMNTSGSVKVFESAMMLPVAKGIYGSTNTWVLKLGFTENMRNGGYDDTMPELYGAVSVCLNDEGGYTVGDVSVNADEWFTLTVEYYPESGAVMYYVNGENAGVEKCDVNSSAITHMGFLLRKEASFAEVYFDNMYVGSTAKAFGGTLPENTLTEILPVKGGADSIVVMIHDDGDLETASRLDTLYQKYSLRGDVALIVNRVWDTATEAPITDTVNGWQALLDTGRWGLINHSMTHTWWGEDESALTSELVTSKEILENLFNRSVKTFATPGFSSAVSANGYDTVYSKAVFDLLLENYVAARGYSGGSVGYDSIVWCNVSAETVGSWSSDNIDRAVAAGQLAVVFMHKVEESANGDTIALSLAEQIFAKVADYVDQGKVWNAHYEEAMLYLREAECASVTLETTTDGVKVTVTDTLDNEIYNFPLTVRVEIPAGWEAVKMVQGDSESYAVAYEYNGKTVVNVDIIPDGGAATLTSVNISDIPEESIPHVHEYSSEWSYDENNHWHAATCSDKSECSTATKDFGAHEFNNTRFCDCGYETRGPMITQSSLYYKNVVNGSDKGFDYTGLAFWPLCVRNNAESATAKLLEISVQMSADLAAISHGEVATLSDGNSALAIGKLPGNHSIAEIAFYNINSQDNNCVVFESDVMFDIADSDQITASKIHFSRFGFASSYSRDGNYIGGDSLTINKMLDVAEVSGIFDPDTNKWGEVKYSGYTFESGKWFKLRMEYYKEEGIIAYYINEALINTAEVDANLDCSNVVFQLQGQAYGSRIYFDHTYFATVDKTYSAE